MRLQSLSKSEPTKAKAVAPKKTGAKSLLVFSALALRESSLNDLRNARGLIRHLRSCHGRVYVVPGAVRCERTHRFVENYLGLAECWINSRIEELEEKQGKTSGKAFTGDRLTDFWLKLFKQTQTSFYSQMGFCGAGDIRSALALLNYLQGCHRAVLEVPGIDSALQSKPKEWGIHCDRAYVFVSNYLWAATDSCKKKIRKLERRKGTSGGRSVSAIDDRQFARANFQTGSGICSAHSTRGHASAPGDQISVRLCASNA